MKTWNFGMKKRYPYVKLNISRKKWFSAKECRDKAMPCLYLSQKNHPDLNIFNTSTFHRFNIHLLRISKIDISCSIFEEGAPCCRSLLNYAIAFSFNLYFPFTDDLGCAIAKDSGFGINIVGFATIAVVHENVPSFVFVATGKTGNRFTCGNPVKISSGEDGGIFTKFG